MTENTLLTRDYHHLRTALLNREELALVDVREEAQFASGHPLFAVNIALSKLDIEILNRIPRLNTPVTLYDNGEGLAQEAAARLRELGYRDVALLAGGLAGWSEAGGELFTGVNSAVKAFAELAGIDWKQGQPDLNTDGESKSARQVADLAGVLRTSLDELSAWQLQDRRTIYLFDIRDAAAHAQGYLADARPVPAGQLVQEVDHYASVNDAWIVLADENEARANITASWLAQLGWQVFVLDGLRRNDFSVSGGWSPRIPSLPAQQEVEPAELAALLAAGDIQVLDFTTSANYVNAHIPGAAWLQLSALTQRGADVLPDAARYVVTCGSSMLARYSVARLEQLTGKPVSVLKGGNAAWKAAGLPVENGETRLLLPRIDRYRQPNEAADDSAAAVQSHLRWRNGLIAQLERDGTHGFRPLIA